MQGTLWQRVASRDRPRDQGLWNCRWTPRLSQTLAYVGHSSHAYLGVGVACRTFHLTVAPCPGYAPWTSRMLLNIGKYLLGRLLGRGSFAQARLSVILFNQIGSGVNSRRKIYGSTSLHFAQLMRLQQEAPPRYFIVWMLLVPEKFQAFFRGSSEQYGFLIKVIPPSIMGGQRNLSLNDSVCPFFLLSPLLPFLFFLSPYPVPGALLGVAILDVPHLRSLRLLLQEPEPKKEAPLLPPLPCKRTLFLSFFFFKSCFFYKREKTHANKNYEDGDPEEIKQMRLIELIEAICKNVAFTSFMILVFNELALSNEIPNGVHKVILRYGKSLVKPNQYSCRDHIVIGAGSDVGALLKPQTRILTFLEIHLSTCCKAANEKYKDNLIAIMGCTISGLGRMADAIQT
ncbi:hypothetical protein VNO77_02102 [Canavalia gladiata]|uniref:Uncharacterized protein n=1 Tax=Canavalia gladiata TaxID=3824 RepID=A0AAN9R6X2_CANGL